MTFKERICKELISGASIYKSVFLDYEYLIFSNNFNREPYYIIHSNEDNYSHLTGVHIHKSANDFFNDCLNGTLQESDFDFIDREKSEKSVIGTVRRKMSCLLNLPLFFNNSLQAEECFSKGRVHCIIATTDNAMTVGFKKTSNVLPQTLMKGNCLNQANAVNISLVLRKDKNAKKFDAIIQGDIESILRSAYKPVPIC